MSIPWHIDWFASAAYLAGIYYTGHKRWYGSTKGYLRGNVWVVSQRANIIKNDATLAELKQMVAGWEHACPTLHSI